VVDVHGVGYELEAPMSTFYDLPELGREVALFTHYAQKEDSVALYGFLKRAERRLFRDLQKVTASARRSRWRCCRACRSTSSPPACRPATSPR
jgi:holliday junction DNA helicase RuvA